MINIAICDDDTNLVKKIEGMLLSLGLQRGIQLEIETYTDGNYLANDIKSGERYDLIYLDIEMKTVNGLETARQIRQIEKMSLLIYITNHESYAKDLFRFQTFEFIPKPIDEQFFRATFIRAYEVIVNGDFYFTYRFNRMAFKVPVHDIMFFESKMRKVTIVTADQGYEYYAKLNEIEKNLETTKANFWRIHQSYLVNYSYIWQVKHNRVVLKNGIELSISEDRHREISQKYRIRLGNKSWMEYLHLSCP